jgi:hypothetical protein
MVCVCMCVCVCRVASKCFMTKRKPSCDSEETCDVWHIARIDGLLERRSFCKEAKVEAEAQ